MINDLPTFVGQAPARRQLCECRHAVDLDSLLRLTPRPQPALVATTIKTANSVARIQFATDHSERNMKSYQISEDRLIVVKKNLVTIKQKDSDKSFEFITTFESKK